MPGLTGIIGAGAPEEIGSDLRLMFQSMVQDGPSAGGTYVHEGLGLWLGWTSHRRSFDDGSPFWNEARDIGLFFSGEDFPDPEELRRLRSNGHDFVQGDAGYLVHLYEEEGPRFVERLNGRFCGVVLDLREGRVVLFNDRYGLGRVYYHEEGGRVLFSSEAKTILRIRPDLRRVDPRGLGEWFSCGCVLQNRTLFSGLSLLPGGSLWTFRPGEEAQKSAYFRPEDWESQGRFNCCEYYEALKETWPRVLSRYLGGQERVAVSLTGGKDSRMIMAWAKSQAGALPCYTFGGPFRDCQDVKLARRVATLCGQPHQVLSFGRDFFSDFASLAERAVFLTDGTMDVSGAPELYLNRLARQVAPVRLTGNYGQEILRSYIAFRPRPKPVSVLRGDVRRFLELAAQTYAEEAQVQPLSFVAFKQVPWFHYSRLALELSQLTLRSPFLDKDIVALAYRAPAGAEEDTGIQMRLIADGDARLAGLPTDRGVRHHPVPLITAVRRTLQQFTFKAEYAFDYGMPQRLVRLDRLLKPFRLERQFLGRHKFVHLRVWYRDELSGYIKGVLLDRRTLSRPYLDGSWLEKAVCDHVRGLANHTLAINQMLTIELIHRLFVDS